MKFDSDGRIIKEKPEPKHPITVVLSKSEHARLVEIALIEDRPPAKLARMMINEGIKKRETVKGNDEINASKKAN